MAQNKKATKGGSQAPKSVSTIIDEKVDQAGKRFFTWGTMGTFTGATAIVLLMWNVLRDLGPGGLDSKYVPFALSFLIVGAFAFLTEPGKNVEKTTGSQKAQKAMISIVNAFLVYSAATGLGATTPPSGTTAPQAAEIRTTDTDHRVLSAADLLDEGAGVAGQDGLAKPRGDTHGAVAQRSALASVPGDDRAMPPVAERGGLGDAGGRR